MFGLFVLCVFNSFFVEAHFKMTVKSSPSTRIGPQLPAVPSSSQTLNLHRTNPALSSQTSLTSMSEVNLRSPSSSSSNIYRSASSPSLNLGNSPSIMREMTHVQAASVLNSAGLSQLQRSPPIMHRMIPNMDSIRSVGKYVKTGALTVAAVGGAIDIQ